MNQADCVLAHPYRRYRFGVGTLILLVEGSAKAGLVVLSDQFSAPDGISGGWLNAFSKARFSAFQCFPTREVTLPIELAHALRMRNLESIFIFALTLVATLVVSILGRRHESRRGQDGLSSQRLNRWLVGLSAGATANSGFVVTGAVGLGYVGGIKWLFLPIAWLAGDIVFWLIFPGKINRIGAEAKATTLTDLIVFDLPPEAGRRIKLVIGVILLTCLSGYVSAQWVAGAKFLGGAFGLGGFQALFIFATVIVVYSALGGFRGSVYADTFQAVVRIIGTGIAIAAVTWTAYHHRDMFWMNIHSAGPEFLRPFPANGWWASAAFLLGFASAALGFGLGQPQIVSRYLAGAGPLETQSAWWIYMGFVQSTWIAMTLFGIALRGVMPGLGDPETGLSVFHRSTTGPIITGIIAADIFATISATANSILVAMAQTVRFDLGIRVWAGRRPQPDLWGPICALGVLTMGASLVLHRSVMDLALSSVSLMGAGLAPPMVVRLLGWRHTSTSLIVSIAVGSGISALWLAIGLSSWINESAPGIVLGLFVNYILSRGSDHNDRVQ